MEKEKVILEDPEDLSTIKCSCENTPSLGTGFWYCKPVGFGRYQEVEEGIATGFVCCFDCGNVINLLTLEVVGHEDGTDNREEEYLDSL